MIKINYKKISKIIFAIFCVAIFFQSYDAQALTPIARVDVVPYQRIQHNTTFNFGVVAFSKAGIDRVEFTITGQGYTGGTKTATKMTHNPQTDVWEYWVPIASNEFTSNGPITITSIAYGEDAGIRNIGDTTLIVEATSAYNHTEAWVDGSNSDGTGTIGDVNDPYPTIATAVSAAQVANGGTSNGNIIYLEEGTYSLAGTNANTDLEWLTISRSASASIDNVIINTGYATTDKLYVKGIRIEKSGSGWVFADDNHPVKLWLDSCKLIGSGLWTSHSNPMAQGVNEQYITDTYIYNVDAGSRNTRLMRGSHIEHFGNDALFNAYFIVNTLINDQDNGVTGLHSDGYQAEYRLDQGLSPISNRILYNVRFLDMHVQGIFMQSRDGQANDMAFVNVIMEQREPGMPNESGQLSQTNLGTEDSWNHLLVWHCSFPYSHSYIAGSTTTNSSFMGNIFWSWIYATDLGDPNPAFSENGNVNNNDFLYNHYTTVYNQTTACTPTSSMGENPCPHWYAKRSDSGVTATSSIGDPAINADSESVAYATPMEGSVLINRIPFATVPADVYGNPRTGNPDVGAVEYISAGDVLAPAAPHGLSVQ